MLKADPFAQLKLLDLQAVDSTLDQLSHRLKNLPEHAALTKLAERRTDVAALEGQTRTEVGDLARDQRKADADVEQVKIRRARDRQRLDSGVISDSKQLQAMQHEVVTLDKRISALEDEELEVMERLEDAQNRLASLESELAQIESEAGELIRARDLAAAEIAERQGSAAAERDLLAADIPDELLRLYDKLRAHLGGVGVGALHQRRCGGCRLNVGAADLARMAAAPSDEVLRCEECNRILVRTQESGL
ncbi:MAG: C4-type zinc ribbon domain-containing protein [Nocardioidaceae bacterium]